MITREDLKSHLEALLKTAAPGDMQSITRSLFAQLKYYLQNYDDLSMDAKPAVDELLESFRETGTGPR